MLLIQSLLGGGQQAAPQMGGDLLGSLLGGQQLQSAGGGLSDGIDVGDLLNAGLAFMNARQQGRIICRQPLAVSCPPERWRKSPIASNPGKWWPMPCFWQLLVCHSDGKRAEEYTFQTI